MTRVVRSALQGVRYDFEGERPARIGEAAVGLGVSESEPEALRLGDVVVSETDQHFNGLGAGHAGVAGQAANFD